MHAVYYFYFIKSTHAIKEKETSVSKQRRSRIKKSILCLCIFLYIITLYVSNVIVSIYFITQSTHMIKSNKEVQRYNAEKDSRDIKQAIKPPYSIIESLLCIY